MAEAEEAAAAAEILRQGVLQVGLRSIMEVLRATDLRFVDPPRLRKLPHEALFVLAKKLTSLHRLRRKPSRRSLLLLEVSHLVLETTRDPKHSGRRLMLRS